MNQKVYFAGSITGGREDAEWYHSIIQHIKKTDTVLTEHVGNTAISSLGQSEYLPSEIYRQDTAWLRESDLVIAECSRPSLGVGYELAYAERFGIPCHVFFRKSRGQLSAMLSGDPYFQIYPYETEEELFAQLDSILEKSS
ncbi:MAG: nucleoside 2-deoxyribosyltransferase [Clostridia bacterium]|nr:nucleoside 2-deoxyribosyltransferase [Clostridia bacterium]